MTEVHLDFYKTVSGGSETSASTYNKIIRLPLCAEWANVTEFKVISMYMSAIPTNEASATSIHSAISLRWSGRTTYQTPYNYDDHLVSIPEFARLPFKYVVQFQPGEIIRHFNTKAPFIDFWITYEDGTNLVLNNTGTDSVWLFHVSILLT